MFLFVIAFLFSSSKIVGAVPFSRSTSTYSFRIPQTSEMQTWLKAIKPFAYFHSPFSLFWFVFEQSPFCDAQLPHRDPTWIKSRIKSLSGTLPSLLLYALSMISTILPVAQFS